MIRKFFKTQVIKYYNPDTELEGHIFSLGRIGGGKSVSTKSVVEGYHDNKEYKIFDLYGGERHEGIYWTIPSQDTVYWEKLKQLGEFDEMGPKQYQVNLLYPYFESKLPKKLPRKPLFVNSKLFTIPLKDVEVSDIKMLMGNLSETSTYFLTEILHKATKLDNAGSLIHLSRQVKAEKSLVYKNFILQMSRENFLMNSDCDYNLDLVSEAKDKKTITVLCLDFVPERFHLFILNYFCRKLTELLDANRIPKKNISFMREAAMFFRATEDSVLEDKYKIFRTNLSHYIRMGRRGNYFALDCQSSSEVRGLVQGCLSEDTILKNYTIPLKNMPDNFKVVSFNLKNNKKEMNNAKKIYTGEKECYEIEFEDNSKIIATKEHRFFNKDREEVKVDYLREGDKLIFIK